MKEKKEPLVYRKLLLISGVVYLGWWFVVKLMLPEAFNPIGGRLLVVCVIFTVLGLSYTNKWAMSHLSKFFSFSLWLITLHYYYLFYKNQGEINWIVGCYITVIAINLCFLTDLGLFLYSLFAVVLSFILVFLLPTLRHSVFLPGLITIFFQANIMMRSRFRILKDLSASDERFRLLFNSASEGVLVHEKHLILDVNRSIEDLFGYSRGELIGKDSLELIDPNERSLVVKKIKEDYTLPYETVGLKKNGTLFEIEIIGKSFEYDFRSARLVIFQDISDRKKVERERIDAQALVESVRIRDEFISIASHELKTPLTSLKLQAQYIDTKIKSHIDLKQYSFEKMKKFMTLVNRQAERLNGLVESMLDVSRISAGKMVINKVDMDFVSLVREVLDSFQNQNDRISLTIEIPAPFVIKADPYRMEQIIENLITNAVKYGNGKSIVATLRVQGSHVLFIVKDHGIGIAPQNLGRIFDRFERGVSADNISGLGLGLYIAKQLVQAHGGTIGVESKLGEESTFTVALPL